MRIPVIKGIIRRRLLVNFRADPEMVRRILPQPFRPKLHRGHAIVGICLIRLEQMRPTGFPGALGLTSENAAHRLAVEWSDQSGVAQEGVYVPRRDTDSVLNRLAGGRIFPGEYHPAQFSITDQDGQIDFSMHSQDKLVSIQVAGFDGDTMPPDSCFQSLQASSAFFEGGSLGYSATPGGGRFDGLRLRTLDWRVRALSVTHVHSSFFADRQRFPEGTIEFDHALVMRDTVHEWHPAEEMRTADFQKTSGRTVS